MNEQQKISIAAQIKTFQAQLFDFEAAHKSTTERLLRLDKEIQSTKTAINQLKEGLSENEILHLTQKFK